MWQDVDAMWEADTAEAWESECEPDEEYKTKAEDALTWLEAVLNHLSDIDGWLSEAAEKLEGYPEENRIISLMDSAGDLRTAISAESENIAKGVRD